MKTTRDELLERGKEIVCREGFGAFSYGMLAGVVGIRKASLHHHFSAKADFGLALLERHLDRLEGERAAAEFDTRRGSAAMRGWLRDRREHLADGARLDLLTAFALAAPDLPEPLRAALGKARDAVTARSRSRATSRTRRARSSRWSKAASSPPARRVMRPRSIACSAASKPA